MSVFIYRNCLSVMCKTNRLSGGSCGMSDQGRAEWIHMLLERMFKPFRINLLVN